EADVVHASRQVRHQIGDVEARLAMFHELSRASQQRRVAFSELANRLAEAFGQRLAMVLLQLGLWIEKIDLTWPADHEHEDYRLGLGLEVRQLGGERVQGRLALVGGVTIARQQPGECQRPEA